MSNNQNNQTNNTVSKKKPIKLRKGSAIYRKVETNIYES
jgi:hypothetical protein